MVAYSPESKREESMRNFVLVLAVSGLLLAGCQPADPTPTPIPPTPTLDPLAARPYLEAAALSVATISTSLEGVVTQLREPDPQSDEWTNAVLTLAAIIQVAHSDMLSTEVPAGLEDFNEDLLGTTRLCAASMDFLATGFDTGDASALETASAMMLDCREQLISRGNGLTDLAASLDVELEAPLE